MVSAQLAGLLVGAGLLAVGALLVWTGVRKYRHGDTVAAAGPLRDHTPDGELVAVEGTVTAPAGDHQLESRYGGAACVAYAAKKVTQKAHGKRSITPSPASYRERASEHSAAVPFLLETDGGTVQVEAMDATVDLADDDYERVTSGEVRENRGLFPGLVHLAIALLFTSDRQRRREYREARVQPGDRVRVVGTVDAPARNDTTNIEPGGTGLILSSRSQKGIADRIRSAGKGRLFWGAAAIVVAGVLLAAVSGII